MGISIENIGDEAYNFLRSRLIERILSGQFSSGERFYSVRDVAKFPGATAHMAQRVLQDLCKTGYLESVPKRGLFVRGARNQSRQVEGTVSWRVLLLLVNPDTDRIRLDETLGPAI